MKKNTKRIATVEMIDIPPEHAGAMEVAWKRARQLSWGMPLFMLNAMKPMLVSIYMQGCVDGFGACERQFGNGSRSR
jgi:hypothetical protein